MEIDRSTGSSSISDPVVDRTRRGTDEVSQRPAHSDELSVPWNGHWTPSSTPAKTNDPIVMAGNPSSSSEGTSSYVPGSHSDTVIAQTTSPASADSGSPSLRGRYLEKDGPNATGLPVVNSSTIKLAHKDSFGPRRSTPTTTNTSTRRVSNSSADVNGVSAVVPPVPANVTPLRYSTQRSSAVMQDRQESMGMAGDRIEDSESLEDNVRDIATAASSPWNAVVAELEVDKGDTTALASRTKRKLSLGGALTTPLPGPRTVSLHANTPSDAPTNEPAGSVPVQTSNMAFTASPLSNSQNSPELPSSIASKNSAIPKASVGASTSTSWTIPTAEGPATWTVEAAESGQAAIPVNVALNKASTVKDGSAPLERDSSRRAAWNSARVQANGDGDGNVPARDYNATDLAPSSLTTSASSRHLASRQPRNPANRTGPQLPSAMNVLPASPPAMYWSKVPVHGSVPRRSFRAHSACLADEVMWLFGGCDSKGCFRDLWCFDTETMCWSKPKATGDLPPPRRAHSATMVDRRLYVFAGGDGPYYFNDLYVFDTIALRWTKPDVFGQPPSPRRAHTSNYYNGQLIIFGGGNGVGALNDVYSLDLSDVNRLEWRRVPCTGKVPIGRGYHTSNLVDGKLIVIGGSDGHMSFNDIHILKLDTRVWYQIKTDEVHNRLGHTATQVGSYLFIVGGHDSHSYTPDILTLNLVNLQWEPRSVCGKKPPGRGYHQAWLRDSRLFIHGGFDGKEIYDDLYHIDLSAASYIPQITSFSVEPEQIDDE